MSKLRAKIAALYELQLIDSNLLESVRELQRIERDEAPVQKKFRDLQKRVDALDKEIQPVLDEIEKIRDSNVKLIAERKDIEGQFFGPASSDHKLIAALKLKLDQVVKLIKSHDDTVLKMQTQLDGVGIRKNEIINQMDEIRPEYEKAISTREAQKEEHTKNVAEQKKKRMHFKNFEDKHLLSIYQQLQKENDGVAIATVEDQVCTSCHIEVNTTTHQLLSHGDEIVKCPNCGCLLFEAEDSGN